MTDFFFLHLLIFIIISEALIKASYFDYISRKISISTWKYAVYIGLPLAFIPLIYKIWWGTINIANPLQTFYVIYPLFIIGFIYFIATYTKTVNIGGADFIGITIILLTLISLDLTLPIVYLAIFIILSIITTAITYLKKNKKFKIPLIIPISLAYFITGIGYFVFGITANSTLLLI